MLARHEQMLDDLSREMWGTLVPEENRFREVASGETIAARPEVQKVLRLIEQPRFRAVLIVEPQRLSRGDLEDIGYLVKVFRYTGTLIITRQGAFDLSEARDRDYFQRELERGNDYLEYTRRIMQNGLRICVQQGWYVGSHPPFGYRKVTIREGKRNVHTLEPDPSEAEAVLMAFRMYAAGEGASRISQALETAGVKTRKGSHWSPSVVYHILANPHYIGLVQYGRRTLQRVVEDGEIVKRRVRHDEPELYPGKHPAIVPKDLWDVVQRARIARHVPPVRSAHDLQNPLAGLVYCECGAVMVKVATTKGRGIRMACKDQHRCGNAGCTIDLLMQRISAALRAELEDITAHTEADPETADAANRQTRLLQSRIDALKAKQDNLWEQLAEGMPRDVFDRLLAKNERELAAASQALAEAVEAAERAASAEVVETSLYAALDAVQDGSAPVKEMNALLRTVIRRITYRRAPRYRDGNGRLVRPDPELRIELRV